MKRRTRYYPWEVFQWSELARGVSWLEDMVKAGPFTVGRKMNIFRFPRYHIKPINGGGSYGWRVSFRTLQMSAVRDEFATAARRAAMKKKKP